ISFEGPIGVGKTTLAESIAGSVDARFFADPVEKVSRFLTAASSDALATEMEFLFHRLRQLGDVKRALEQVDAPFLADGVPQKPNYSGRPYLTASAFKILMEFVRLVGAKAPRPDVIVILHAPADIVLERIARRGRSYEQNITAHQIEEMGDRFEK